VPDQGARGRLVSALTNMGYRPAEAEKAVASLGQRVDSAPLAELLKAALAELR
jgi:Holliday junction DNA helicase RuvA